MNISLLRKIVVAIASQNSINESLIVLDELLLLMKKFGKQMSQDSIAMFVKEHYPDAYSLYTLLWWARCSTKDCLLLRKQLRFAMWEKFLISHTSHESIWSLLKQLNNDILVEISWDVTNPSLLIQSPTKTYKRSLHDDLAKVI